MIRRNKSRSCYCCCWPCKVETKRKHLSVYFGIGWRAEIGVLSSHFTFHLSRRGAPTPRLLSALHHRQFVEGRSSITAWHDSLFTECFLYIKRWTDLHTRVGGGKVGYVYVKKNNNRCVIKIFVRNSCWCNLRRIKFVITYAY